MNDTKKKADKTYTLSPEQLLVIENSLRIVLEALSEKLSKKLPGITKTHYKGVKVYDLLAFPDVLEIVADSTGLPQEILLQYRFQVLALDQVTQTKERAEKSSIGGKKSALSRLEISRPLKAAREFLEKERTATNRTERSALKEHCAEKHHATVAAMNHFIRQLKSK
jgi:hypothetical protein